MWNETIKAYANTKKDTLDKKIAKYLYELDDMIYTTTLVDVAKALNVVPSTVTKFLKKCGFNGWKIYSSFAYLALSESTYKKITKNRDELGIIKDDLYTWMNAIYSKDIEGLAKKITKYKNVYLISHGATQGYLTIFKRNLQILNINTHNIDMSDKYVVLPKGTHNIFIIYSISGKNSHLKNTIKKINQHDFLGTKIFVTASDYFLKECEYNINIKRAPVSFSIIENVIPLAKGSFIQHLNDMITKNIIELNKNSIFARFEELGYSERLKG